MSLSRYQPLIKLLIDIQEKILNDDPDAPLWRWQMGVSTGDSIGIGDILLPKKNGVAAAKLMSIAKDSINKTGGYILVDSEVVNFIQWVNDDLAQSFETFLPENAASFPAREIKRLTRYDYIRYIERRQSSRKA